MESAPRSSALVVALTSLLGAAAGEATSALLLSGGSLGSAAEALALGWATASLIGSAGLLPTMAVGLLAGGDGARRLGRGLAQGLGGEDARFDVAALVGAIVILSAAALGVSAGVGALGTMTPPFAVAAAALSTIALGGILLLVAPLLGRGLALALPRIRWPRSERRGAVLLALAGALSLSVAAGMMVDRTHAGLVAGVLVGGGAGLALAPTIVRARSRPLLGAALVLCLAAMTTVGNLGRLPPRSLHSLTYQTAFAGPLLAMMQRRFDRDGDGHARAFGGADCDDDDDGIHPGARDEIGDGVDQDCSGSDAQPYHPPPRPRWARPAASPRMNILLLMVDALRPDHLGFAGYERPTSPHLDAFRDEAVWFRNAYTPSPSTRFAMASMFTGRDVRALPHRRMGANRFRLEPGATTLAERLGEAGYRTVGHTISYVMHHIRGIGQGFEEWGTPWPVDEWASVFGRAGEITTDAALESLRSFPEAGDERFLLYAHYRCTHDPYVAHDAWDFGSRPIDRYDSALAYCDDQISRLLAAVDARDDRDRTAVFIVSDHGELFGEQGFRHHGHTLSEPDVRILMMMRVPGVAPDAIDAPVLLTDVAPTILDLAHLDFPEEAEGWSLLPYALGQVPEDIGRQLELFTDMQRGSVRFRAEATIRWPEKEIRDLRLNSREVEQLSADAFYSRR